MLHAPDFDAHLTAGRVIEAFTYMYGETSTYASTPHPDMPLLGYGQDALTFHAFTSGLAELFRQLGDPTDAKDSIRFFRPSFGRRGSLPGAVPARAAFGEFDGIIGSAHAVYLVEAKWTGSGELTRCRAGAAPPAVSPPRCISNVPRRMAARPFRFLGDIRGADQAGPGRTDQWRRSSSGGKHFGAELGIRASTPRALRQRNH
ncbi:hypothetical protein BH18VER1_BH18VER1_12500 [soil metagenome]